LFPGVPLPLHIFEPRYKEMITLCLADKAPFGLVRAKQESIAEVGCTAAILSVAKMYTDGRMDIATEGRQRFEIVRVVQERAFLQADVAFFDDEPSQPSQADLQSVMDLHKQLFRTMGQKSDVAADHPLLSFQLASELPVDLDFKQTLLEMKSEAERIETLIDYYRAAIPKVEKTLHAREKAATNGHVH
jgi:Lon protease-like protein